MTNVLVVYATREGQTEKIARHIAKTLTADGHTVKLHDADRPASPPLDLASIQVAVVGGPIRGGNYPRSLVRFVQEHRRFLEGVPSAFFSVGLAVQSPKGRDPTLEVVERFVRRTGWRPSRVELIAGALLYTHYNFLIRFVMKRIVASDGGDTDTSRDYEYTDWPAVERFARELVAFPRRAPALAR